MKWQPIETAPKDGRDILLFDPGSPECGQPVFEGYWEEADFLKAGGSWTDSVCGGGSKPTHWMPISYKTAWRTRKQRMEKAMTMSPPDAETGPPPV